MTKCIWLLLALISFAAFAMEKEIAERESSRSFFPLCLYIPTWLESNSVSLSPMQRVQADKDAFEEKLKWKPSVHDIYLDLLLVTQGQWSDELFDSKPTEFLRYCYKIDLYNYPEGFKTLFNLDKNNSLFAKCKQARIDGYSALGAAIIAESVMYKDEKVKDIFIVKLKKMGFELTFKDKQLLALEIYNSISAEQKQSAILLLMQLHKKTESNFSVLPSDLMVFIVGYMTGLVLRTAINTVGFVHLCI